MTERQCTFPIAPEVYVKMTPAERDAAGTATFEQQQRRDGSGMLRAIEQSGRDRERLQRCEAERNWTSRRPTISRASACAPMSRGTR